MARVPVDASIGTQRSIEDLNAEIRSILQVLDRLTFAPIKKDVEDLQADVKKLQLRRIIPPPGQRAFTGAGGLLYLDDNLNWSGIGQDVGVRTVTSSTSVDGGDFIILVDASAGDVTLSLPAASLRKHMLEVKKIDNTVNKAIIDAAGSDTIDGDTTLELLYLDEAVPIVSDGVSEWNVL
jgi:hypothetical protein